MGLQETLRIVEEGVRRFSVGEIENLDELYAPDARLVAPEGWPEPGPFIGRDAIVRQFARLREDWAESSMTIENARTEGDWSLVELHWRAQGAASGASLEVTLIGTYRAAGGVIQESRFFWGWDEALAEVGVPDATKVQP